MAIQSAHSPTGHDAAGVSEAWLLNRYHHHGDEHARDELVRRMMPLVRRVATAYSARGHGEDLHQVACLGLVKAIDRYDSDYGVPLRTYAIPTMFGEVRRYLRDHGWAVRVPRPLQERVLDTTKAMDRLTRRHGRSPTPQQLADEMGCTLEEALEGLEAGSAYTAASFEAPVSRDGEGEGTLGDVLGYDDGGFDAAEDRVALRDLRGLLDDRERRVLYLRFVEDLTQSEIARRIDVSQMQVSRILRRSIDRLSAAATAASAGA